MKDSFVFYESFYDILQMLPDDKDWRTLIESVCEYAFTGEHEPLPTFALEIAFKHFQVSIDGADKRYQKAIEDGKKGGRPRKWIDQTEAELLYSEFGSWEKVAEELDVSRETLRKARAAWLKRNAKKPKNLSVSVSVSDSDAVAESESDIRNNNKPSQTADGADAPPPVPDKTIDELMGWPPLPD